MSDHGTQFFANEDKKYKFEEYLKLNRVKLIEARVKHLKVMAGQHSL
jgi:hypothetical protein